jgi:hypothetical protein
LRSDYGYSVIASNVDIPLLADVDDFGATPLNVYRFARVSELNARSRKYNLPRASTPER